MGERGGERDKRFKTIFCVCKGKAGKHTLKREKKRDTNKIDLLYEAAEATTHGTADGMKSRVNLCAGSVC
jgi:hypothetical protein